MVRLTRGIAPQTPEPSEPARAPIAGRPAVGAAAAPAGTRSGFQRAQVNVATAAPVAANPAADGNRDQSAAEGFLINGPPPPPPPR